MGSVDEGLSHDQGSAEISVELNEVALKTLASGDPCLRPCVDCGLVTKRSCDRCWGEDHFPQDKWEHGRLIPLCNRCDLMYLQCHFCRGEDWCVPAPHWYRSIDKRKYLPLSALHKEKQLVQQLANSQKKWDFKPLSGYSTHKDEKRLVQQLAKYEKKWDPALQEYVYLLRLQSTENERPSSSSTEAASGDLHT